MIVINTPPPRPKKEGADLIKAIEETIASFKADSKHFKNIDYLEGKVRGAEHILAIVGRYFE